MLLLDYENEDAIAFGNFSGGYGVKGCVNEYGLDSGAFFDFPRSDENTDYFALEADGGLIALIKRDNPGIYETYPVDEDVYPKEEMWCYPRKVTKVTMQEISPLEFNYNLSVYMDRNDPEPELREMSIDELTRSWLGSPGDVISSKQLSIIFPLSSKCQEIYKIMMADTPYKDWEVSFTQEGLTVLNPKYSDPHSLLLKKNSIEAGYTYEMDSSIPCSDVYLANYNSLLSLAKHELISYINNLEI